MESLKILLRAIISIVVLFFLTKAMGKKQISQLNFFDYCVGISIGSIAATLALDIQVNFWHPILAMVVYGIISIIISSLTEKSIKFRRLITGESEIIMQNGKIFYDKLKKSKMDLNDFLTECRNQGYFNISDIYTAIVETNGKLSILPVSTAKPISAKDMDKKPKQDSLCINLILDGKILHQNLQAAKLTPQWLDEHLKNKGFKNTKEVFLAYVDSSKTFEAYSYKYSSTNSSYFE